MKHNTMNHNHKNKHAKRKTHRWQKRGIRSNQRCFQERLLLLSCNIFQVNFSLLDTSTLKKYKRTFKIRLKHDASREELVTAVEKHFAANKALDEVDVLDMFIYLVKNKWVIRSRHFVYFLCSFHLVWNVRDYPLRSFYVAYRLRRTWALCYVIFVMRVQDYFLQMFTCGVLPILKRTIRLPLLFDLSFYRSP